MAINKGSYGWWEGKGYQIVTKRLKILVDGKTHRVVELKLVYDPPQDKNLLTTQDWRFTKDTLWVPIGNFTKYFKLDETIGLLFEKEANSKEA